MSVPKFFNLLRASLLLALCAANAGAHGAFDHNVRVWLFEDHLETTVTMGPEAAKVFLNLGPEAVLHAERLEIAYPLPAASAARMFEIKTGTNRLALDKATVRSDGIEFDFAFFYPRPAAGTLQLEALYLNEIPALAKGSMVVVDEEGRVLAGKILSPNENRLEFLLGTETNLLPAVTTTLVEKTNETATTLSTSSTTAVAPAKPTKSPALGEFVRLGIRHILTGFDHLLFLGALLVGVRRIGPMLAVITCFTLAHSVTLALAATNVVSISSRIVEPIIAASIIVVGIENLFRRDATRDRYWLAGGFGLIHGFGFAGALRETGLGGNGAQMVGPLFGFNLGVELGQLAVAALVVPLLFWLRRAPGFARFGAPAISTAVIAVSSYWLLERTLLFR